MKIMVVDPAFEYSTLAVAESYYRAFSDLKFQVMEYDTLSAYKRFKQVFKEESDWYGLTEAMTTPMLNHVVQDQIDFVLVIHGCHMNPSVITSIRALGVKTGLILTDEPHQTDVSVKWSMFYDYVFSNDYNTVKRHNNCYYLPTAADENIFKPGTPDEKYRSDVLFGITFYPERRSFVCNNKLYERLNKYNVKCVGARQFDVSITEPWYDWFGDKKIPIDELARYVRGAKICVDIPRNEFRDGVFGRANTCEIKASNLSPRIYEAGLSASLVMTTNQREDIFRLFKGIEYPIYSTVDELCDLIDYYLVNENEWLNIVTKHYNYCNEYHTYKARVNTIADIVGLRHSYNVSNNVGASRRVAEAYGKQWAINVQKLSDANLYCSENDVSVLRGSKVNGRAIVINNGPTLDNTFGYCEYLVDEINVDDIYTLNQTGTYLDNINFNWGNLIAIHPTDHVYNRIYNGLNLENIKDRKLFSSTVVYHGVPIKWIECGGSVYFFATGKEGAKAIVDKYYKHTVLNSGITVSWNALALLKLIGYSEVHLFGFDFGYVNNKRYVGQDWTFWDLMKKKPTLMESTFGHPVFTDEVLLKSLEACKSFVKDHPEVTYIVYGDGLFNNKDCSNLRNVEC